MAVAASQIASINPATDEVLRTFDAHTREQVEDAIAGAQDAFVAWRARSFAERAVPMNRLAALLRERSDRYARLMTLEMGKPITEAKAEIEKCALGCEFFAENAERFLSPEIVKTTAQKSYVAYEPLGIVLAVMPWNFPFWQVIRFAAPAFMAGNAAILKHASNVPQCALAIEEAFRDAGFPDGLLRTLLLAGAQVEPVIADERIRAVTLTGSSATGARIAAAAGRALKKAVLELGGSDPFIVLADADVANAAAIGVRARNQNAGQSCIAAKRFLVADPIGGEFEKRFVAGVEALRIGDPLDAKTQIGPLARADLRDNLERQVKESVQMGARLLTGGKRWGDRGAFYTPTVLADVTPDMPVFAEETFGPVAAIIRARDADEAIELANRTEYGLGANLWTRDTATAERLARRIESGQVFINGMVASDPRLPFGGVKHSGFGRELSAFGIREFVNIQTVWIGPAQTAQATPKAE
ncbi:MAG: NAD-dependent succinate-semialdehyde dehydrogenase [Chloroflexi bacterium]|nr:MAG: NAD-dependent succinate-semialdehyde dehydrogenase [Chloroflexota bacterium]TMC33955.1 MAG: NAD-dependent succinate-semialdehyde dehydrogenase [Chloroflexota bacterium]